MRIKMMRNLSASHPDVSSLELSVDFMFLPQGKSNWAFLNRTVCCGGKHLFFFITEATCSSTHLTKESLSCLVFIPLICVPTGILSL